MLIVALLFVLVYFFLLSSVITSLREEKAGLCASLAFVCTHSFCWFCHVAVQVLSDNSVVYFTVSVTVFFSRLMYFLNVGHICHFYRFFLS